MIDMLKNYGTDVSIHELTIKQLKYELRPHHLHVSGNKGTLINRLTEFFDQEDKSPPKRKQRL